MFISLDLTPRMYFISYTFVLIWSLEKGTLRRNSMSESSVHLTLFVLCTVSVVNNTWTKCTCFLLCCSFVLTRFGCYSQPSPWSTSCSHWHNTVRYIVVSALGGCVADFVFTSNDDQFHCYRITLHCHVFVRMPTLFSQAMSLTCFVFMLRGFVSLMWNCAYLLLLL